MIAGVSCSIFREIKSIWLEGVLTQKLILHSDQFVASVL